MRLMLKSSPEVFRWTLATGDRRNRIAKGCDGADEARQTARECSPLPCSIPGMRFRVIGKLGSEVAHIPLFRPRQTSLESLGSTESKPYQHPSF